MRSLISNVPVLAFDERIQRLVPYRVMTAILCATRHESRSMFLWQWNNECQDEQSLDCHDDWIRRVAMSAINACAAYAEAMPDLDPRTLQAHCAAIALALIPAYWDTPAYNPCALLTTLILWGSPITWGGNYPR